MKAKTCLILITIFILPTVYGSRYPQNRPFKKALSKEFTCLCQYCFEKFAGSYIDRHVKSCPKNPDRLVHLCDICNRKFSSRDAHIRHLREIHKQKIEARTMLSAPISISEYNQSFYSPAPNYQIPITLPIVDQEIKCSPQRTTINPKFILVSDTNKALYDAVENKNHTLVKEYFSDPHRNKIDFCDSNGNTLLHIAVLNKDMYMIQLLLDHMDNIKDIIEHLNKGNLTPLEIAIFTEQPKIIKIIEQKIKNLTML